MGKHKHFKVKGFLNVWLEAEIYAFQKIWENGFPWYKRSMGKHKHFKFMGFVNILGEAEIHTIPRIWEK